MLDLSKLQSLEEYYQSSIEAVESYSNELYEKNFSKLFEDVTNLKNRYSDTKTPITDSELEIILTTVPLRLFDISEKMNDLSLRYEVICAKNKEKRSQLMDSIRSEFPKLKVTELKNIVDSKLIDNELFSLIYSNLLSRIDSEISTCKELIMGAKKVWDRRKQTESSNPVGYSQFEAKSRISYRKEDFGSRDYIG